MIRWDIIFDEDRGVWSVIDPNTGVEAIAFYNYEAAHRWALDN